MCARLCSGHGGEGAAVFRAATLGRHRGHDDGEPADARGPGRSRLCAHRGGAQAYASADAHDREGVYVACGEGVLQVTELQFAGRKRCTAAEALNSSDLAGRQLGDEQ